MSVAGLHLRESKSVRKVSLPDGLVGFVDVRFDQ